MKKTIRIGRNRSGDIYCRIEITDGCLSISGVVGPLANGDCRGPCGQINMRLRGEQGGIALAPGWTRAMLARFFDVWEEWHLNDLQAGSPAQMAWIAKNPLDTGYPKSWYTVYRDALKDAGLNPDPNYLHEGKPYSFGSRWLRKEIPPEVVSFLSSLPDTDKTPAWV